MIAALLLLASTLENPSFEKGDGAPARWELWIGAQNGKRGPSSVVAIEREVARHGRSSLRLEGDAGTIFWRAVKQSVPVKPGDRVLFRVAARCRDLRREGNQYPNANALLMFFAADGRRIRLLPSPVLQGDRDWVDLHVHDLAPPGSVRVEAAVFCSMSGRAWFDDARLEIAPAADRALAGRALRCHLERTYPFWGIPGKPSPDELPALGSRENLVADLRAVLAPLKDVHIWIDGPGGRTGTVAGNPNPPNWNPAAIRRRVEKAELDRRNVLVGRIGEIGYAGIGSFVRDEFEGVEEALDRLVGCKALILDVRMNGGGDERLARRIAGRFADRERVYAKSRVRDPTRPGLSGFGPAVERRFLPRPGRAPDERPVVVLQGPYCVSSTEAFLLMMRVLDSATTLGLPSRGSSGNPKPLRLFPGVTVWISTWLSLTPDGVPVEGAGVEPEVRFEAPPADYRKGDPTLERALKLLK